MTRFVQLQNPVTLRWVRVDMREGSIVGHRAKPYACPLISRKEKHGLRVQKRKLKNRDTNIPNLTNPG